MTDSWWSTIGNADATTEEDFATYGVYTKKEIGPSADLNDDVCYRTMLWMDRARGRMNVAPPSGPSKRRRKRPRTKPLLSCFKTRKAFYEYLDFDADGVSDEPEHIHLLQTPGVGFSFWKEG